MPESPETFMEMNGDYLAEDGRDVILIEGLKAAAQIGILDSEKNRTQTVCFDIEMQTVTGYRRIVRETGAFVS